MKGSVFCWGEHVDVGVGGQCESQYKLLWSGNVGMLETSWQWLCSADMSWASGKRIQGLLLGRVEASKGLVKEVLVADTRRGQAGLSAGSGRLAC